MKTIIKINGYGVPERHFPTLSKAVSWVNSHYGKSIKLNTIYKEKFPFQNKGVIFSKIQILNKCG